MTMETFELIETVVTWVVPAVVVGMVLWLMEG